MMKSTATTHFMRSSKREGSVVASAPAANRAPARPVRQRTTQLIRTFKKKGRGDLMVSIRKARCDGYAEPRLIAIQAWSQKSHRVFSAYPSQSKAVGSPW